MYALRLSGTPGPASRRSTFLPAEPSSAARMEPAMPAPLITTSYCGWSAIAPSIRRNVHSELIERRRGRRPVPERELAVGHEVSLRRLPCEAADVGVRGDHAAVDGRPARRRRRGREPGAEVPELDDAPRQPRAVRR